MRIILSFEIKDGEKIEGNGWYDYGLTRQNFRLNFKRWCDRKLSLFIGQPESLLKCVHRTIAAKFQRLLCYATRSVTLCKVIRVADFIRTCGPHIIATKFMNIILEMTSHISI